MGPDRKITKYPRAATLAAGLFWLAVWQLAAWRVGQKIFLPSPLSVLESLWQLVRGPRYLFEVTEQGGDLEGEYVTAALPYIYGLFAEETTEENGAVRSTHQMYVVDANQTQYMALQLDPDRYQEAERLYEETWTYIESGSEADLPVPLQVTGRLSLMEDPDLVAYYEDMFGGEVSADEVSYWMLEDGLLEGMRRGEGVADDAVSFSRVFAVVAGRVLADCVEAEGRKI